MEHSFETGLQPSTQSHHLYFFEDKSECDKFINYINSLHSPDIVLRVGSDILDWYLHILCRQPSGAPFTLAGYEIEKVFVAKKYRRAIDVLFLKGAFYAIWDKKQKDLYISCAKKD